MIPIGFTRGHCLLSYFSMVTTVGTPQTIAAQELRIESMFPADEMTEAEHLKMVAANAAKSAREQSLPVVRALSVGLYGG